MIKLSDVWEPMSKLRPEQKRISDNAVRFSYCVLAAAMLASPVAVHANRMQDPSFNIPSRPPAEPHYTPEPPPPVAPPAPAPAPPPVYQPPAPQPTPPPPVYQPPAQQPQTTYGTFRAWGELPPGRVSVYVDNTFEHGQILGYEVYVQDNGANMNDQMVIMGPKGEEEVWIDCHNREEWKAYGPNESDFVHAVVSTYCDWNW